ncbi:MAG: histidine kinase, partial [Methanocorpusculum sp.]|nr:histidine kinase [Methanocorpusculum sp.]
IPVEGVIIYFRDGGPMIAGPVGGPVIGGVAGLLGGAHRFLQGGDTALPCFVATVAAGILAGYAIHRWKG